MEDAPDPRGEIAPLVRGERFELGLGLGMGVGDPIEDALLIGLVLRAANGEIGKTQNLCLGD